MIERLEKLATEMHAISMEMLADINHPEVMAKGVDLQGASAVVWTWIAAMKLLDTKNESE